MRRNPNETAAWGQTASANSQGCYRRDSPERGATAAAAADAPSVATEAATPAVPGWRSAVPGAVPGWRAAVPGAVSGRWAASHVHARWARAAGSILPRCRLPMHGTGIGL